MSRTVLTTMLTACLFNASFSMIAHAGNSATSTSGNNATDARLAKILGSQPSETKARYEARRPSETMAFCEIAQGDTVIESHPGGGWYSQILYPYLGKSGRLIAAQYPLRLFKSFGWDDERLQSVLKRDKDWPGKVAASVAAEGGNLDTYHMTEMPDALSGSADKFLFIRSLHNLNRFGEETKFLKDSIAEAYRSLKPGGIACVVQHQAAETMPDAWANGSNGYLKQSLVVAVFEAAGFKLTASSDMHINPKDTPTEKDNVWRLPPSYRGAEEGSDAWRAMKDIGESTRMTLKFVKPAE